MNEPEADPSQTLLDAEATERASDRNRRGFPLRLNCPHCRNPIALTEIDPQGEAVCPVCGSSFHVDTGHTISWSPDRLPRLGKFELLEAIGRGAFGTVYRARDTELDRIVAVKVPRSGVFLSKEDEDRFVREARSAAQLSHPGIVPVYEVGHCEPFPFIVAEFVEGVTLSDALTGRSFTFREAADLTAAVADALQHAHSKGVVHRDLKPSNIILQAVPDSSSESSAAFGSSRSGAAPPGKDAGSSRTGASAGAGASSGRRHPRLGLQPRILDFGLARKDEGEMTVTTDGQVLGTPAYMSPEQARGQGHHADGRSDVYSLGVILYRLVTGELPFRGNPRMLLHQVLHDDPRPPRKLNDRIPRDLETICLKALAKEPGRRYQSAAAMADDLRRFLAGEPILARPLGLTMRLWRTCRRRPLVASLILAAAVLSAAVVASIAIGYWKTSEALELARERETDARRAQSAAQTSATRAFQAQGEADQARRAAETTVADLHTAFGLMAGELNKPGEAALWFAAAAGMPTDAQRVAENRARFRLVYRNLPIPAGAVQVSCQALHEIAFSPSNRYVLIRFDDRGAVWDWSEERLLPPPDLEGTTAAAWSPRHDWLAIGRPDGETRIVEIPGGQVLQRLNQEGPVTALAFHGGGDRLATAAGAQARVWDVRSGAALTPPLPHPQGVTHLGFDSTGNLLATSCQDNQVRVFPVASDAGQPHTVVAGLSDQPGLLFHANNPAVLTRTGPREFTLWDAANGQSLQRFSCEEQDADQARAVVSPAASRIAIYGGFDVWLYDTAKLEKRLAQLTHLNWTRDAAFSPDGKYLLTGSIDRQVFAWSANSGAAAFGPVNHADEVVQTAFAPHGRMFATAQHDGLIRVWQWPARADWTADVGQLDFRATLSDDGRLLATAGWSIARQVNEATVYDVSTGAQVGGPLRPRGGLNGAAFSPNGKQLATLSSAPENAGQQYWSDVRWTEQPGWVQFWNWSAAKEEGAVATPSEPVAALYHPRTAHVLVLCAAGQLLAIDPATQTVVKQLEHPGKAIAGLTPVRWIALSPQGDRFATCGLGSAVHVWDAGDYTERFLLQHDGLALDAEFSPDGRYLATASRDKQARVWDAATGRLAAPLLPHADWVFHVDFRADGQRLLTACRDHTAQVWDWRQGERTTAALMHADEVFSAGFSPDGRWIVTSSRDSTARVWSAASGKPLSLPYPVDYGSRQLLISPDGRRAMLCGGKLYGLDLSPLAESDPAEPTAPRLRLESEIAAGQRLHETSVVNLTSQEWLERWKRAEENR